MCGDEDWAVDVAAALVGCNSDGSASWGAVNVVPGRKDSEKLNEDELIVDITR